MHSIKLTTVLSVILGAFFVLSGVGKMIDVHEFVATINRYGFGRFGFIVPAILGAELALGIGLILQWQLKKLALASLAALVLFTTVFAYGHFTLAMEDCGCFGAIEALKVPPAVSFMRNFVLMGLSVWLWKKAEDEPLASVLRGSRAAIIGAVAFSTFAVSDYIRRTPQKSPVSSYEGKHIKDTPLARYAKTSADSAYLFFAFSPTCDHCWDATANVKVFQELGTVHVIGLGLQVEDKYLQKYIRLLKPNFPITPISKEDMNLLTDIYPTAFYVKHDTVHYVMRSMVYSPYTMKGHFKKN